MNSQSAATSPTSTAAGLNADTRKHLAVLAGVDLRSTYCYLLACEDHRDAVTWGVHLLDLEKQRLHPERIIADGGKGLRAGQALAWSDVPCYGDVFHGLQELGRLASHLERRALGATSAREALEEKMTRARKKAKGNTLSKKLALARADEEVVGRIIHKPMFERLILCYYAVADLTCVNADVFYELGIRHAVRPKSTVLIFAEGAAAIRYLPLAGIAVSSRR